MKATIKYKKACYVCKCKFILCCAILFFCFFSPFSIYSSEFSSELIKINKSKIDTISDNIIDSVDKQLIVLELNVGKTTPTPIDINKCEHATMAKVTIKKLSIHLDSFSHNSYWNHNNSRTKGMVDNIQTINHELDAAAYISESIEDLISYTIKEQTNSMRIARSEYTQQTLHHPEKKPDAGKIYMALSVYASTTHNSFKNLCIKTEETPLLNLFKSDTLSFYLQFSFIDRFKLFLYIREKNPEGKHIVNNTFFVSNMIISLPLCSLSSVTLIIITNSNSRLKTYTIHRHIKNNSNSNYFPDNILLLQGAFSC